MSRRRIAVLIGVMFLSFSVRVFAQFDIRKLKTAGTEAGGQATGALSESLKSELKNIGNMLLQNVAQDKVIGQWKNLLLANKTVNVDSAIAFVKQFLQADQLQQKQQGLVEKVRDYSGLLKQMSDVGKQIVGKK